MNYITKGNSFYRGPSLSRLVDMGIPWAHFLIETSSSVQGSSNGVRLVRRCSEPYLKVKGRKA